MDPLTPLLFSSNRSALQGLLPWIRRAFPAKDAPVVIGLAWRNDLSVGLHAGRGGRDPHYSPE